MKEKNNSISFNGKTTNIQVQQNTHQSSQQMDIIPNVDLEQIAHIFEQIRIHYGHMDLSTVEESRLSEIMESANPDIRTKTNTPAISNALSAIRSVLINASGNVVAAGILSMISKLSVSV